MFARLFDNPMAVIILVLIIVVVFGWKRLPDAARSLGRSTRILKSELDGMNDSKASKETVQGQTTQQPGSVPGEAPTTQQQPQQPPHGQAPGQAQGQPGQPGPQQGS